MTGQRAKSPLLSATKTEVLTKQKLEIPEPLFNEVTEYCNWVGIETFDDAVRQSLEFVLNSDKAWQQEKKSTNKPGKKVKTDASVSETNLETA